MIVEPKGGSPQIANELGKLLPCPLLQEFHSHCFLALPSIGKEIVEVLDILPRWFDLQHMFVEGAGIKKYGLDDNTVDFIGHALALQRDDRYLNEPALDTVKRMKSLARFQGGSPYIYPLYGLGELPQAFARLSAVYGGTYMLNKPECKVEFNEGKVIGVTSEGETTRCKKVVCDPSYLQNKVRKVGKVARAIAIMSHPIPNTNDSHSVQVILPQKQLGRQSDMYLFCCSYSHNVAPKGKFIAFVSTDAETDNPEPELKPGIDLLGPDDEIFFDIYDRYELVNEPTLDYCFISTVSYTY
ncbi:guanosine nucleotide diphosphate dissociation inhibitor 2-like [Humulus lupulus]|uniref:guanosine nucleotide diphosphate dissociation inhibitor 2-like n=1 Tax=Humulus lupulus TaxID=3486 RepID=UPI002B408434|nr:guanosine nucleotide diphosphate dissociation inhibitor 2-like [Humulus lupulus]